MSDFTEAWAGLKLGQAWRRKLWTPELHLVRKGSGVLWSRKDVADWEDVVASLSTDLIDATDWERVDERPTMDWAAACKAMLDRKVVERGRSGIRIRLNSEDDLIFDDEEGAYVVVTRADLEATDWREVRP